MGTFMVSEINIIMNSGLRTPLALERDEVEEPAISG